MNITGRRFAQRPLMNLNRNTNNHVRMRGRQRGLSPICSTSNKLLAAFLLSSLAVFSAVTWIFFGESDEVRIRREDAEDNRIFTAPVLRVPQTAEYGYEPRVNIRVSASKDENADSGQGRSISYEMAFNQSEGFFTDVSEEDWMLVRERVGEYEHKLFPSFLIVTVHSLTILTKIKRNEYLIVPIKKVHVQKIQIMNYLILMHGEFF